MSLMKQKHLALQELQAAERESRAVRPASSLRPVGPHAVIPCQRKPMKIGSDFEEASRSTFLFLQGESAWKLGRGRGRGGKREKDRDRETETDRQRQAETETDRQRQRQKQTGRQAGRLTNGQTEIEQIGVRENSDSKTLFDKDCSLGSVKYLSNN